MRVLNGLSIDYAPAPESGSINLWSTWGPTFELDLKPDISAPGGYILSTWPTDAGSYSVISGTSMVSEDTCNNSSGLTRVRLLL